MTYSIFNNTVIVEIPDDLVKEYTKKVAPFDNNTAEYLAVTGDCEANSNISEIQTAIIDGIHDEIDTFGKLSGITAKAVVKGLVR